MITQEIIKQRQSLPLELKVIQSQQRIREWYNAFRGQVYVAFSGGKDSTILLHLVRELYPDVPAVFCDTGLEYPEIRDFVKTFDNVIWLKPKMGFKQVLEKYGYPLISKEQAGYIREVQKGTTEYSENKRRGKIIGRNGKPFGCVSKKWQYLMDQKEIMISDQCCDVMKKRPFHRFEKETKLAPIIGTMASDSQMRMTSVVKYGCNAFEIKRPQGRPLSMWNEADVWEYLKSKNISYCKIYDMGYSRTGCMFCMFGVHLEKGKNRFQIMKETHPLQYKYCIENLGCGKVLDLIKVKY